MKWIVRPSALSGAIAIPPSKSHTIRALLVATLCRGASTVRRPLLSGDGASAAVAAKSLGAGIEARGADLIVTGIGSRYDAGGDFLDMGNSGTSTSLFMSAAALGTRPRRFDGDASLRSRPFRPLLAALGRLGATYSFGSDKGDLPFTIQGPIRGGKTVVSGVSSQYVSSLLFTAPLLADDTEIAVENPRERPYIELTLWWLARQGIALDYAGDFSRFRVRGGQSYPPFDLAIPSDFSGATFAAVAAAITGASLTLTGLDFSDPQGDKGVFGVLERMGASVARGSAGVAVSGPGRLAGQTIDLNAMPDALPALAVAACAAEGVTSIVNVAHARLKETDRITVMREELSKMGAGVAERPDGLVIRGGPLRGAAVNGRLDHRVVMALALAGMIAQGETVIEGAEAAAVTYPSFAGDFRALGARIEEVEG